MSKLEVALLGPPEIRLDGGPVRTDRRKAIALLAYLAVTRKAQAREVLSALLWPDYEQESAYAYLRRTLWELNQILKKGWIEADRDTVRLSVDKGLALDTAEFEDLLEHTGPERAADQLETAIGLYRGDFMAGFAVADTAPFEDWQSGQAEYFRRLFAGALESLVETRADAGEFKTALPHARRWLALDPLNESAQRAIMRLLAGMGDRSGAIRQYEACVQILKGELGIPPQPETEELYQAILHGEIAGTKRRAGVTRQAEGRPPSRLPQMPTPFIGRRAEVEEVKSLLANAAHRLVTLVGPGGTGKTRLSIQAASELVDSFPDGVFFASLASVQNAEAIPPALAKALDFAFQREGESPRGQLLDFLREKHLLLILDNFEHLLEGTGLVTDVLTQAAGVKLMVTSRVRLNMRAEQLFNVTGMRIPDAAEAAAWRDPEAQAEPFSAVELFLDRARRVKAGFALTRENIQPVLEICNLVQGMPLGIELAAAWLELLPPKAVAAEIARSLDFLETDQADVPDRQRSIRAVFESSWKLLGEDEREAFLRLCVFVGSFSREAAQQVSGAALKTLLGLANKSWLQQTEGGRFQLHDLMRQYGMERLRADGAAWREAKNLHAGYFSRFVAVQSLRMRGPEQPAALNEMETEFATNVKAAWDWLVAERRWGEIIENMVLGLFQFGTLRWQSDELITWLRKARLALESDPEQKESLTFTIIGTLEVFCEEAGWRTEAEPTERLAAIWDIVAKYGFEERMGFWFVLLAGMELIRNPDPGIRELSETAVARFREQNLRWEFGVGLLIQANWWSLYAYDEGRLLEALQVFRELGVVFEQGLALQLLGRHAFQQRRPPAEVAGYFQQAKELDEQLGNQHSTSIDWVSLAGIYFEQGEAEKGFSVLHDTRRLAERAGNMPGLIAALNWEGLYAVRYSTRDHALQVRGRSLELARKLGSQSDLAWHLFELGDAYRIFGEPEKGLELYEQAYANFKRIDLTLGLSYLQRAQGDIALQEGRYADALEHYREFMRSVTHDNHLWSIGQAHGKLALAHAYLGERGEARRELKGALTQMRDWRENGLDLIAMLAEPVCLLQDGRPENAIELAAFILHHPLSWNETKQQAREVLETASRGLPAEAVRSAIERGQALDLEATVAELTE